MMRLLSWAPASNCLGRFLKKSKSEQEAEMDDSAQESPFLEVPTVNIWEIHSVKDLGPRQRFPNGVEKMDALGVESHGLTLTPGSSQRGDDSRGRNSSDCKASNKKGPLHRVKSAVEKIFSRSESRCAKPKLKLALVSTAQTRTEPSDCEESYHSCEEAYFNASQDDLSGSYDDFVNPYADQGTDDGQETDHDHDADNVSEADPDLGSFSGNRKKVVDGYVTRLKEFATHDIVPIVRDVHAALLHEARNLRAMTWHEAQLLRAMCKGKAYKQFGDDYTATHTNAETSGLAGGEEDDTLEEESLLIDALEKLQEVHASQKHYLQLINYRVATCPRPRESSTGIKEGYEESETRDELIDEGLKTSSATTTTHEDREEAPDHGPLSNRGAFKQLFEQSLGVWKNLAPAETAPLAQDDLTKFSKLFQAFLSDLRYERE
jgi:hypothetical protein